MNKNQYLLQIPEPCHESWDKMDIEEKGRFCKHCAKQVIDFTSMTDRQVIALLFNKKHKICGRVSNNQLNRILTDENKNTTNNWLALLTGFTLMSQTDQAQAGNTYFESLSFANNSYLVENNNAIFFETIMKKDTTPLILRGIVLDNKGEAIAYASVMIKGTKIGVPSDAEGRFEIKIPFYAYDSVLLEASAVGYVNKTMMLKKSQQLEGINLVLDIREIETTTGAIVTMRKRKWWQFWRRKFY